MKSLMKYLLLIFLCFLLLFSEYKIQKFLDKNKTISFIKRTPVFLPDGETLKWMSMGYRSIVADWLWIKTVLYYGRRVEDYDNPYYRYEMMQKDNQPENAESKNKINLSQKDDKNYEDSVNNFSENDSLEMLTEDVRVHIFYKHDQGKHYEYVYPLLDRVTTVNPHFEFPYIFGGFYLLLNTKEPDPAYKLLYKGAAVNPDNWRFLFYMSWIEWMYRRNPQKSIGLLFKAAGKDNCPPYVENMLSYLMKFINVEEARSLNKDFLTKTYLRSILMSTDNKKLKKRINEYLKQME